MEPNLYNESIIVRGLAAKTFISLFKKTFDPKFMNETLDIYFLQKLH